MPEQQQIRFEDGASYERMMGLWSRLAGEVFLDWLAPPEGLRWVDVGCGNGAFTELLVDRCAPARVDGVDPSEAQLRFARERHRAGVAHFQTGSAMALPLPDASVDAAAMALVIFFVPEPATGVAEMARVVRPGGLVGAYAWDMEGGGFPFDPVSAEMRNLGFKPGVPPRSDVVDLDRLKALWIEAGLVDVETRAITVERKFASFDEYWEIALTTPSYGAAVAEASAPDLVRLKRNVQARVAKEGPDGFVHWGRAHAVKGRRP